MIIANESLSPLVLAVKAIKCDPISVFMLCFVNNLQNLMKGQDQIAGIQKYFIYFHLKIERKRSKIWSTKYFESI